ncbi:hypothetical protein CCP2SC5_630021 [Azospirillaceae bacterium]
MTINLAGGNDSLDLSSSGNNTLTISNIETLIGGASIDIITLGNVINTITLTDIALIGGASADVVTFTTAVTSMVLDFHNATEPTF